MNLGEFRKATAGLPDSAELVASAVGDPMDVYKSGLHFAGVETRDGNADLLVLPYYCDSDGADLARKQEAYLAVIGRQ